MKITILGTKGEIKETLPQHALHSGILIDQKILLDLGEREFLSYNPKWIFLTHLHPDHAYFVRQGKEEIPNTSAPIFAPERPKKKSIEETVSVLTDEIHVDGYTVMPIPTHHSKLVKSQAYLIKKHKKSLLYTGDLVWINKEYHPLIGRVDLVITEASFLRKNGMIRQDKETHQIFGHQGVPNLLDLFKSHTNKIVLMHFGSWFFQDPKAAEKKLIQLGKEKNVEILVAHDHQEINL